jgi:MarR family transcriptional regulator, organic hydroperoxide resistance regulator
VLTLTLDKGRVGLVVPDPHEAATEADVVPVDDRLGLALAAASRAMGTRCRSSLERLQLTYPQFQVMSVLWEDGSHVIGALAERLALDVSTISPVLKRLEAHGLVIRRRDPRDERRVVVTPTERGMALRSEERSVLQAVSVVRHLSAEQERRLVRQLQQLTRFLEA